MKWSERRRNCERYGMRAATNSHTDINSENVEAERKKTISDEPRRWPFYHIHTDSFDRLLEKSSQHSHIHMPMHVCTGLGIAFYQLVYYIYIYKMLYAFWWPLKSWKSQGTHENAVEFSFQLHSIPVSAHTHEPKRNKKQKGEQKPQKQQRWNVCGKNKTNLNWVCAYYVCILLIRSFCVSILKADTVKIKTATTRMVQLLRKRSERENPDQDEMENGMVTIQFNSAQPGECCVINSDAHLKKRKKWQTNTRTQKSMCRAFSVHVTKSHWKKGKRGTQHYTKMEWREYRVKFIVLKRNYFFLNNAYAIKSITFGN